MIQAKNLHHTFKDKTKNTAVLKDVNFNIEKNEFISIIGPSGCGKTTLINILAGYIKPTTGEIKINNQITTSPNQKRIVINQENDLFNWMTVKENIELGIKNSKNIDGLIDLIELNDFKDHYPHQISGGMKKKVSIARALATDTDFIIMDEPFGSLDYQYKEKIHCEILKIWKKTKKTFLLITHDIEEAILLSNKVIIFSDRPATIKKIIGINIAYPRNYSIKNSSEFIDLRNKIRALI